MKQGSNRCNDNVVVVVGNENWQSRNEIRNKFLLIVSLLLIVVSRTQSSETNVPAIFGSFPSVYFASQVLVAVSFFISFVGVITRGERFSRFCSGYSSFCLALLIISSSSVVLLPQFDLPFWLTNKIYAAVVTFTNPFPLFLALAIAMPLVYQI